MKLHRFLAGRSDCVAGVPSRSSDPDYLRGYGEAYAMEQCITAHYLMEPVHRELNNLDLEIAMMNQAIGGMR